MLQDRSFIFTGKECQQLMNNLQMSNKTRDAT